MLRPPALVGAPGLLQAAVEFNCFAEDSIVDTDDHLRLFRQFWDAEVPARPQSRGVGHTAGFGQADGHFFDRIYFYFWIIFPPVAPEFWIHNFMHFFDHVFLSLVLFSNLAICILTS